MAMTQGDATSAYSVQAAEGKQIGAIRDSHSLWRRIGTRRAKKHGPRRGEVETLERVWGWRICGRCGETLVLGEVMLSVPVGEGTKDVCLGCAGGWGSTEEPTRFTAIAHAAADESPRQKTARAATTRPAPEAAPGPEAHRRDAYAA
jgi:hypothetical protein